MSTQSNGRQRGANVDGLLLLNKPKGITSNQALQKVKRLLKARKAGHTGSLDPAATGMLPLCFGEATKVCAFLLEADKTYRVTAMLGASTDTGDAEGDVVATAAVPDVDEAGWLQILARFVGESSQVPPMYSALKQGGKRLYELARQGKVVEREARRIRVDALDLLEAHNGRLVMRVRCSKGTYVRTLVEDIAAAAGTVAHTASLHRESVGDFRAEDMLDLSGAEAIAESGPEALRARLLATDQALSAWQELTVSTTEAHKFCGGQPIAAATNSPLTEGQMLRVYGPDDGFLGVGQIAAEGRLAPRRIFHISRQ